MSRNDNVLQIQEEEIYVFVGSNSLSENTLFKKSYSIKKIFPHKGFSIQTIHDDIGLIQLNDKIEFNKRVKPIKFAVEKDLDRANYAATLSGWGKLKVKII